MLKFGAGTFLGIFTHFQTERNIFKPKNNFSQRKQHFHIQRRPKCYSNTSRTPSPMSSHWLHCQDYRDNVYIFMYTLYLYALCVSRPDTPNTIPFSVYAPLWPDLLIRLIPLYVYVLLIRLMLRAPLASPFNPYTYTFNLYVLLIRYTYTYYIYFILTCNTYIFYLQLNVEFPSFFSNFLGNFFTPQNFLKIFCLYFSPKYFYANFSQNIYIAPTPKISTKKIE